VIAYASNTGTRRNLEALSKAGWRILITPANPRARDGMRYAIDNGAWTAHRQGAEFDGDAFTRLVDRCGLDADFVVLPDIVSGGMCSLSLSVSWIRRLNGLRLLLPVQDGMERNSVIQVLTSNPSIGIFLGGSTSYKLTEMRPWGAVAAHLERWYHVGRVNTARRVRLCAEAGATSFDGTSATMFCCTVPLLDAARRQPSLLVPRIDKERWLWDKAANRA